MDSENDGADTEALRNRATRRKSALARPSHRRAKRQRPTKYSRNSFARSH